MSWYFCHLRVSLNQYWSTLDQKPNWNWHQTVTETMDLDNTQCSSSVMWTVLSTVVELFQSKSSGSGSPSYMPSWSLRRRDTLPFLTTATDWLIGLIWLITTTVILSRRYNRGNYCQVSLWVWTTKRTTNNFLHLLLLFPPLSFIKDTVKN